MEWEYLVPLSVPAGYEKGSQTKYLTAKQLHPQTTLEYVKRATPSISYDCKNCKLIKTSDDKQKFKSGDTDCTIYCIRNPQLWLANIVKENVTHVKITTETYPKVMKDDKGMPIAEAAQYLGFLISEWFTDEIVGISQNFKKPNLQRAITEFKNTKTFEGVTFKSQYLQGKGNFMSYSHIHQPHWVDAYFKNLPNGQLEVSCDFQIAGNALKETLNFEVPLFRM